MADRRERAENIGVINPYALAEAVLGREIDWTVDSPKEVLPEVLGMPYERLFDPALDSPLYAGLVFDRESLEVRRAQKPGEPEVDSEVNGVYGVEARATDADGMETDADRPEEAQSVADVMAGVAAGAIWEDKGIFFREAVEFFDPRQGAVGDCYLIAALSSVAWAFTYEIAQRCRATGTAQESFYDMITFFEGSSKVLVEVTEKVPTNAAGNFIYCRSTEDGEVWPAIYEKAYAKWRTGHSGDTPDLLTIAGGDPVLAMAQLTGRSRNYYGTSSSSTDTIYKRVRENSISRKTFNPMVAWTYSSGMASPDRVNYSDVNLVANHAYSILGWDYRNDKRYIILRNPWAQTEASTGILTGSWTAWDAPYYGGPGWWRTISLSQNDGVFGLEVGIFKKYFAGLGVVK
jgi:hypothetical protein